MAELESTEALRERKIAGVRRTERRTNAAIITMRICIGVIVVVLVIGGIWSLALGAGFTGFGGAVFAIVMSISGLRAYERRQEQYRAVDARLMDRVPGVTHLGAVDEPTLEEAPLTPALLQCIKSDLISRLPRFLYGVGALVVVSVIWLWFGVADYVPILTIIGLICMVGAILPVPITIAVYLWRERRHGVFIRASGPVKVIKYTQNSYDLYDLHLGIDAFRINPKVGEQIADIDWGTVEYSDIVHTIFSIRDKSGALVYSAPGYPTR